VVSLRFLDTEGRQVIAADVPSCLADRGMLYLRNAHLGEVESFIAHWTAPYRHPHDTKPGLTLIRPKKGVLAGEYGFTNKGLGLHTDRAASFTPPTIVATLLLCQSDTGGESLFVDGREIITKLIRRSMDKVFEDRDYQRRLVQYQTTRIKIDLMEQQARWNAIQDESRRELLEFKTQQLQLLGLLAAVVAFVATAGSIAARSSASNGVELMQVMAGAVIIVFATFSLMSSRTTWRVVAAYSVGALLIIVPTVVGR
jgi:hypothetical protein